ncbi:MAG: hypothetical protein EON96_03315 [Caulobacteraceae bacterium]|nr:MAG: hypothetical protein EON96_03315 [Caulobacteraceae bacterium]
MSAADDEQLRQEREAFDLNRVQSIGWFWLQMATGCIVLGLLVVVAAISAWVILNSDDFSGEIVVGAIAVLFVDVIGLATIFLKLVLSPTQRPGLTTVSGSGRRHEP